MFDQVYPIVFPIYKTNYAGFINIKGKDYLRIFLGPIVVQNQIVNNNGLY